MRFVLTMIKRLGYQRNRMAPFLCLLFILNAFLFSGQIIVPDDNPSLPGAARASRPGDTLVLKPGTYDLGIDSVVLGRGVSIIGQDPYTTRIKGIRGFPVQATDSCEVAGVAITGGRANMMIRGGVGARIHHNLFLGPGAAFYATWFGDSLNIEDNLFLSDYYAEIVVFEQGNSAVLRRNIISNPGGTGVFLSGGALRMFNNEILGCKTGLQSWSVYSFLNYNNIHGNLYGISAQGHTVTAQFNNICGNDSLNVYVDSDADAFATMNWWGTTNLTAIKKYFYDKTYDGAGPSSNYDYYLRARRNNNGFMIDTMIISETGGHDRLFTLVLPQRSLVTGWYLKRRLQYDLRWDTVGTVAASDTSLILDSAYDQSMNYEYQPIVQFVDSLDIELDTLFLLKSTIGVEARQGMARNQGLAFHPNPFKTNITISVNVSGSTGVTIYDLQGRLIARLPVRNGSADWNAAGQPAGVYLVQPGQAGKTSFHKVFLLK